MSTVPAEFLAGLAAPLTPERPPFYVKGASSGSPDGWYWKPAGAGRPMFLGRNAVWAERRLLELLRNGHGATAAQ